MNRYKLYAIGAHSLGIINASIVVNTFATYPLLAVLALAAMLSCANVLRLLNT